jgi:hypothetical protein
VADKTTKSEDATEVLVPAVEHRVVTIGQDPLRYSYVQKPLSFFQKMEVFAVLGKALDRAMSGPDGITVSELLDGPNAVEGELSADNFRDADTFVRAISKLVQFAPEILLDLFVVVLGVPRGQRDLVKEMIDMPEDEGGLSDEDGIGILETFIDQNWEVMVDFFTVKIQPLIKRVTSKLPESQPSKPSKNTQQATPKQ